MIDLMLPPLAAAFVILLTHAYFGLHVIQRGVIFVDLALAQIAALGGVIALLAGAGHGSLLHMAGSFAFTLVGALIFSFTRMEDSPVPQEAFIGITFVLASAAVILLSGLSAEGTEHLQETMTGTLIWVDWGTVGRVTAAYAVVAVLHVLLRRPMLAISFAPDTVRHLRLWDFFFYATFGFVITQSVALSGVLMVFSVLVMPAVVAFLYTRRFGTALLIAWGAGTLALVLGIGVSFTLDVATGPTLVLAFGAVLIGATLLWPRFGVRVTGESGRGLRVPAFAAGTAQEPEKAFQAP